VDIVKDDITQLYDNWFIETCDDWVVEYIGDLIGYQPVQDTGGSGGGNTRIIAPRREVANTIRNRRRKGTVAVLESLARETSGWPVRVVELYRELGWTQHLDFAHRLRGRLLDLRDAHTLDLLGTPFDRAAHAVHVASRNIPSVDVFVWRLNSYPVTWTQARCIDEHSNCYVFSVLGNDTPLFTVPERDARPDHIASELEVPGPIRRRVFELRDQYGISYANPAYYGPGKSIEVRVERDGKCKTFSAREVIPADLTSWHYHPPHGKIGVDPALGRLAFRGEQTGDVWVRYQYGFSAGIGGGEYDRPISQPDGAKVFYVGTDDDASCTRATPGQPDPAADPARTLYPTIADALRAARDEKNVVIEITDSRLYEEPLHIRVVKDARFQLRASNGKRPVIQIPDRVSSRDALRVEIGRHGHFTLDGLLVSGRSVNIRGHESEDPLPGDDECPRSIVIRHCTLVPGWSLDTTCKPMNADKPSIEIRHTGAHVTIEHSILGSIEVSQNEALTDPLCMSIADSIVDATSPYIDAIGGSPACSFAYATLTIARTTVIGHTHVHAIALAEDSIFQGLVEVARRQIGCVRFCWVPPKSRTPRRFECQPDLVIAAVTGADQDIEAARVEPRFNSTRYGSPVYCQLSLDCAVEIASGASDDSEMGVFHDLFQPQRAANLRVRLNEYVPASADIDIIFTS
jgi:hypothetical protein